MCAAKALSHQPVLSRKQTAHNAPKQLGMNAVNAARHAKSRLSAGLTAIQAAASLKHGLQPLAAPKNADINTQGADGTSRPGRDQSLREIAWGLIIKSWIHPGSTTSYFPFMVFRARDFVAPTSTFPNLMLPA